MTLKKRKQTFGRLPIRFVKLVVLYYQDSNFLSFSYYTFETWLKCTKVLINCIWLVIFLLFIHNISWKVDDMVRLTIKIIVDEKRMAGRTSQQASKRTSPKGTFNVKICLLLFFKILIARILRLWSFSRYRSVHWTHHVAARFVSKTRLVSRFRFENARNRQQKQKRKIKATVKGKDTKTQWKKSKREESEKTCCNFFVQLELSSHAECVRSGFYFGCALNCPFNCLFFFLLACMHHCVEKFFHCWSVKEVSKQWSDSFWF